MNGINNIKYKTDQAIVLTVKWDKKGRKYSLEIYNFILLIFKLSFNNLFFILASSQGKPFFNLTAGKASLRNSQKTTALATRVMSLRILTVIEQLGHSVVHLRIKGYGVRLKIFLRELMASIRPVALEENLLSLVWVEKSIDVPLNGCKQSRRIL